MRFAFRAPAAGRLEVAIRGFSGEWALQLRKNKDAVLAADDVPPPAFEELTIKLRKASTINVLPCNIAGSPEGMIDIVFTYS